MDNKKFVEFLSTKMIALMETPELQRKIRNTSSNLLDKKEFDSKNLSDQAKAAIKVWAKEIVRSELVPQIEGKNYTYNDLLLPIILEKSTAVVDAIKQDLLNIIPTPQGLSFDLFVTKKILNDALTLIQKQLRDSVDRDEVIQTIYSFLLVDAIFVQPEIAADSVLDTLAVWARIDGQNKDKIKAAAHDLIGFGKHKGMKNILGSPEKGWFGA